VVAVIVALAQDVASATMMEGAVTADPAKRAQITAN